MHVGSVHVEHALGLIRDVRELGNRGLHPECHLVLGDPGLGLGIGKLFVFVVVQAVDGIERTAASGCIDSLGVGEEEDRVADGPQGDSLVLGGQVTGSPEAVVERLCGCLARPRRGHHDECRQVLVHGSQTIGEP